MSNIKEIKSWEWEQIKSKFIDEWNVLVRGKGLFPMFEYKLDVVDGHPKLFLACDGFMAYQKLDTMKQLYGAYVKISDFCDEWSKVFDSLLVVD